MLFRLFKFTLIAVILIGSILTAFHALHSETVSHLNTVLPWFAAAEAIAALLLLLPKVKKVAAVVLLVIFATAIIVHGPAEQLALFLYAASVLLVGFGRS